MRRRDSVALEKAGCLLVPVGLFALEFVLALLLWLAWGGR